MSGGLVRPAGPGDFNSVTALLAEAGLPLAGLAPELPHFFVVERDGRIAGAAGLERYGSAALLRSVVVAPSLQGTGLGQRLVEQVLDSARADGIRQVFLLTTTAAQWFPRFGFAPGEGGEVPEAMRASAEFSGACPASAVLMRLRLESPSPA